MNSDSITVQTKEGKEIPIKKKDAMLSNFLKEEIEKGNGINEPISLQEIDEKIIGKIYEYLEHCKGIPPHDIEKP